MWFTYTVEFQVTVKKSKIMKFALRLIQVENVIVREKTQVQKDTHHTNYHPRFLALYLQM